MKLVIVDPYTNLPDKKGRPSRYVNLATSLYSLGYDVHIYMSNFSHVSKTIIADKPGVFNIGGIYYHTIDSGYYKSHISIRRILYEIQFAKSVVKDLEKNLKPHFILFRDPLIFQSKYLIRYAKKNLILYGVDIIDLWPELFVLALPGILRRFEKIIFGLFYNRRKNYLAGASLITSVSKNYLSITKGIPPKVPKQVFYWGANISLIQDIYSRKPNDNLNNIISNKSEDEFWLIYAGTLGSNYDLKTIIDSAAKLSHIKKIKFLVAGSGPLEDLFKPNSSNQLTDNIIFFGQLKFEDLFSLLFSCDIGLITYSGFSTVSMPIKAYDYLAAGLSLINSLDGEISQLIVDHNLGMNYIPNNSNSFISVVENMYNQRNLLKEQRKRLSSFAYSFDEKMQYKNMANFIHNKLASNISIN